MRSFAFPPIVALALFPHAARTQPPVDACDPPAPIEALSPDRHSGVNLDEPDRIDKIARIREVMAQFPDDLFLNRWLIELQPKPQTGSLAAEFREKLARHPDDPRYMYLYARALVGKDTPSALQLLQKAIAREPQLPWTYLALTEIYSSAAFHNGAQVAENLRAYHKACPANSDAFAYLNVIEDERPLRELAGALRAQLQSAIDPRRLRYYSTLWTAEFRLAPPAELEQAKKAVAEDLKRIEPLAQDSDLAELNVLSDGYRLSGQRDGEQRTNARIAAARPRDPAFETYQAWEKDHPRGSGQEARKTRSQALYKASGDWVKQWPDSSFAWEQRRVALIETRSHSAEDWKQVADGLTHAGGNGDLRSLKYRIAMDWTAAGVMVKEAVDMLRELLDWSATSPPAQSDLIQGTIAADLDEGSRAKSRFAMLVTLADAAIELKDFDLARSTLSKLRKWLDTDFPKYYDQDPMSFPDREGRYLLLMARLAQSEGRKLDALAYYHQLIANPVYVREYAGPVDTAHNLFKELGGSDEAWAVWSKPQPWPADKPDPPRGWPIMAWNVLNRTLPELHVPDAAGRIWTLADFKAKTTFVFLWATWCSPCWQELPGMQKVYEAVKDRSDVQAISLSMDENPAIVERFLKERKFSFPVLVSKSYVEQVLPEVILGQTWLVDQTASIRLQRQNGLYLEKVWVDEALDKLKHPPR
ncbi:MAG: redoxin domain-containing protein [Bryobacteraceae bacterium]|jgi:thiol-disulfide isomerase/thioredoxin